MPEDTKILLKFIKILLNIIKILLILKFNQYQKLDKAPLLFMQILSV